MLDQHITAKIIENGSTIEFLFTVLYGSNDDGKRLNLWDNLKRTKDNWNGPWSICGDFNNLLDFNERIGRPAHWADIAAFRDCVDYCEMMDIKAQGAFYTWNNKHDPSSRVVTKQRNLKQPLKELNRNKFSDIEKAVRVSKCRLEELQMQMHRDTNNTIILATESSAADEYRTLSKAHFSCLNQKSKVDWVSEGDENTPYFHNQIKSRQMRNKIIQIKDKEGITYRDYNSIKKVFLDYYVDLLGTNATTLNVHKPIVRSGALITDHHTHILLRPVSPEENRDCIFFYSSIQITWPRWLLQSIRQRLMGDYWEGHHWSCPTILYYRLGEVLPDIVNSSQGGLVKGRIIMENALICQDLVRLYNKKAVSFKYLIKIDLRKAYDIVEWIFVEQMLKALKFPARFIHLIMTCVTSPSYSLNVNGNSFGFFNGKRGL
ncbi:uncharacterized protein LOC141641235 [Silene latifolia]|uniref:uncharacterized protein LOC141641235 n=1 Tax=Silene latifolia TaxID=37657 RepID=UPI003D776E44